MNSEKKVNIHHQAQRFADITKKLISTGHIHRAKRCIGIASSLMEKGNREMQDVISNVYVHSVSSFMETHHCSIRHFFPRNLREIYIKHINSSAL